jgi:hypothetical protein
MTIIFFLAKKLVGLIFFWQQYGLYHAQHNNFTKVRRPYGAGGYRQRFVPNIG